MMNSFLNFPSQKEIHSHLENHILTKDPILKENGLFNAIAAYFANKKMATSEVSIEVFNALYTNKEKIKFDEPNFIILNLNLKGVLLQCGKKDL